MQKEKIGLSIKVGSNIFNNNDHCLNKISKPILKN